MDKILLKNFYDRDHDYDIDLPVECEEHFHIFTCHDYLCLYDMYRYGYLCDSDFSQGWRHLRSVCRELANPKTEFLNFGKRPDEKTVNSIDDLPAMDIEKIIKPEYRLHLLHDSRGSGINCGLCKKKGWKGKEPVLKTIGIEDYGGK